MLSLTDVADRRGYQDTIGALERAEHDLDRKSGSILPPSVQFDPCVDLLGQRLCVGAKSIGEEPFRESLWNDVLHVPAEEYIASVSKLLLRPRVQQDDLSRLVDHHHSVRSRFQKSAIFGLGLRQMPFRVLTHSDIADRRCHQDSLRALKWAQHDLDGKLGSVLAMPDEFDSRANLLRQRFSPGAGSIGKQPLSESLRNDSGHIEAQEFVAPVTELFLCLSVQQDDFSGLVHDHHSVRSRFQKPPETRLRALVFAQISTNLRKSAQISGLISQGSEGQIGQKL